MKLTYETGTATLIQFLVLALLNIANGLNSVVTTCHRDSRDCVNNLIVSIVFYLLVVGWFGFIWVLGYTAQERRSKKLALLLIGAELMIAMIAYFNAKHHSDVLSLTTSVTDLVLAFWVIFLAIRLIRAKGGRVVSSQRARRRRLS